MKRVQLYGNALLKSRVHEMNYLDDLEYAMIVFHIDKSTPLLGLLNYSLVRNPLI